MQMATLGKTGLQVSRLGAGLFEIGSLTDVSVAGRVLNTALDGGCTIRNELPQLLLLRANPWEEG